MGQRGKPVISRESAAEQEVRAQEVLRANRELAAYFKGRRTEREARAALKIIKAFVRDRERRGSGSRPALPSANAATMPKKLTKPEAANDNTERHRRTPRRKAHERVSKRVAVSIEPPMSSRPQQPPDSDEPTP